MTIVYVVYHFAVLVLIASCNRYRFRRSLGTRQVEVLVDGTEENPNVRTHWHAVTTSASEGMCSIAIVQNMSRNFKSQGPLSVFHTAWPRAWMGSVCRARYDDTPALR